MQSLHVPKIETPNYLILIWLFYPFKYIVRFILVFCRFDSAHHYSGNSNIQDEIAEQTLSFNSGTLKRYCMNCLKMTAFNTSPPFFRHSFGQTNIILNIRIVFNIWIKNHLQSVTLCSVEPMNITKCSVFAPKVLCQVCSCLQYMGLCAFSFVFNTCEMWMTWPLKHIPFLWLKKLLGCTVQSVLCRLAESEQRIEPCTLYNSSYYF